MVMVSVVYWQPRSAWRCAAFIAWTGWTLAML